MQWAHSSSYCGCLLGFCETAMFFSAACRSSSKGKSHRPLVEAWLLAWSCYSRIARQFKALFGFHSPSLFKYLKNRYFFSKAPFFPRLLCSDRLEKTKKALLRRLVKLWTMEQLAPILKVPWSFAGQWVRRQVFDWSHTCQSKKSWLTQFSGVSCHLQQISPLFSVKSWNHHIPHTKRDEVPSHHGGMPTLRDWSTGAVLTSCSWVRSDLPCKQLVQ